VNDVTKLNAASHFVLYLQISQQLLRLGNVLFSITLASVFCTLSRELQFTMIPLPLANPLLSVPLLLGVILKEAEIENGKISPMNFF
jgi:uncharacterized membrane protein